MAEVSDFDRDDRPVTAQPPPQHVPGAPSVHDLVSLDVARSWLLRRICGPLLVLLAERRAFGLRKYGTVLQVEDPKRLHPEHDLLEELGDALVYAYRAKARRVPGATIVYWGLRILAAAAASWWYPRGDGRG